MKCQPNHPSCPAGGVGHESSLKPGFVAPTCESLRGIVAPCNAAALTGAAETFVNEAAPSARIIVSDDKMVKILFCIVSPLKKYKSLSTNLLQDTKLTILLAGIGRKQVVRMVTAGRRRLHTRNCESMGCSSDCQNAWERPFSRMVGRPDKPENAQGWNRVYTAPIGTNFPSQFTR